MLILAFETSAKAASVALLEDEKLLGESYQNSGLTHSVTLLKMAEDTLENCGKKVEEVTAVAAASGPGSFTGIRIGVSAAKGFAWGRDIPCLGVSTLEAMATGVFLEDGILCPVMDARRSQVYNALFLAKGEERIRITKDRAISLSDLEKDLQKQEKNIFLVGDGANLCYNTLGDFGGKLRLLPEYCRQQRAVGVARTARKMLLAGETPSGAEMVPNYLRLSQAERERLERLGQT